jgi:ankyrin repeat protein
VDDDGRTTLFAAVQEGHVEVVMALLAHDGIAINQTDNGHEHTPLCVAVRQGHVEVAALLANAL